ncbi:heat shock factor protein 3-like [Lithobates pipiens]
MKEPSAPLGSPPVPAFLMKLWALLEDPSNSDVITWNWDGQNFCILDDQRFSKEILPKYFKHNNLSSFIRQLNMYGFRKVMSLESGLVRSECGSAIEFQHPSFKKGRAELLEHIKRKISSSVKSEEAHLSQEDLQKVVAELQDLKHGQNNMDAKLENMRRENEMLWKEVSSLRRKHNQQQKLLTKILQFILSLMRGNIVMAPKRKRQLTLEPTSSSPPPKYSRNVLQFPEDVEEEVLISSQHSGNSADSTLQIHEIFSPGEGTSKPIPYTAEQTQDFTAQPATPIAAEINDESVQEIIIDDSVLQLQSLAEQNPVPSSSAGEEGLALDLVQANSAEDADRMISSILNENAASSNELLYREEIQDFLSCIDASLEELQTMLCKKKLNVDDDIIDELFKPDLSSSDNPVTEPNPSTANDLQGNEDDAALRTSNDGLSKDKQLMQYTGNPLVSLFDLSSGDYGTDAIDPANLLTTMGDDAYVGSSAMQNDSVPGCSSSKEPDLLAEDFSGPQEILPLFVLSPVNKLIDEAKEAEEL